MNIEVVKPIMNVWPGLTSLLSVPKWAILMEIF